MSKESKDVMSYCRLCGRDTHHSVLSEHSESYREEYACNYEYQVVGCKGCDTKSFRIEFADLEGGFLGEDGEWDVPVEITLYPKPLENHQEVQDLHVVPDIVRKIYTEVLLAIKEEAKVLAGLGLRAAIEAVCNDQEIKGRTLEVRIGKLATEGLISKKDAERLHGIRFMGNDAAHDIKAPKDESIRVALQIVEHLIASVYILEKRANGTLDTAISKFDEFKGMLTAKIGIFSAGEEIPIAKILGKDIRRVKDSLSALEGELITRIQAGTETKFGVGKIDHYCKSATPLQHFVIK